MISDMENLGKSSSLSVCDKRWLEALSDALYEEGWYTKSMYLAKLIDNSIIINIDTEKNNG